MARPVRINRIPVPVSRPIPSQGDIGRRSVTAVGYFSAVRAIGEYWEAAGDLCNNTYHLICYVNPHGAASYYIVGRRLPRLSAMSEQDRNHTRRTAFKSRCTPQIRPVKGRRVLLTKRGHFDLA